MSTVNDITHYIYHNLIALAYYIEALFRLLFRPARKDISGKTVLVTGAGSGLGQGLAVEFAKLGATVVGWDISERGLKSTNDKLLDLKLNLQWIPYKCDVSNRQEIYQVAKKVNEDVGDIDILVNNAGVVTGKTLLQSEDASIMKTMQINSMAHFWTLKAFLPSMLQRNEGHIVTVASAMGLFGAPGLVDYCTSKFAAVGIAETLDAELYHMKKHGVHSTLVCPLHINTGMFAGVDSPFIPFLEASHVVDSIVDGILRNYRKVIIPPLFLRMMLILKWFLPTKTQYEISASLNMMDAMKTFTGRKED